MFRTAKKTVGLPCEPPREERSLVGGCYLSPESSPDRGVACSGPTHEWHLLLPNPLEHLTFGFLPRFHQTIVRFGPAFLATWLVTVGAIRNTVADDCCE